MNSPIILEDPIRLALDWLADSGISQGLLPDLPGGISRGYDCKQKKYDFLYSEITGYAISCFIDAFRWTGEPQYVGRAEQCGQFLLQMQDASEIADLSGGFVQGIEIDSRIRRKIYYSFDAAMCLQGLMDLYELNQNPLILSAACRAGNWLIHQMQHEQGYFWAARGEDCNREHPADIIFGDQACLHAKHAIGLLKLGSATGSKQYIDGAIKVCDWVLSLQNSNGAFAASPRTIQTVSHTHCYATEGLLFAFSVLHDEKYFEAAKRSAQWLLNAQNKDGSISIAYNRPLRSLGRRSLEIIWPKKVTDSTSQAVRIWLIVNNLDPDRCFVNAAQKAAVFLLNAQMKKVEDKKVRGALAYWPGHAMLFSWGTMFFIHAMVTYFNQGEKYGFEDMIRDLF